MENTQATSSKITVVAGEKNKNIQKWLLVIGMPFLFFAIAFLMVSISDVNVKSKLLEKKIQAVTLEQEQLKLYMGVLNKSLEESQDASEKMNINLGASIYALAMAQEDIAKVQLLQEINQVEQNKQIEKFRTDFKNFNTSMKIVAQKELKAYMQKMEDDVTSLKLNTIN